MAIMMTLRERKKGEDTLTQAQLIKIGQPNYNSISVDAAIKRKPGYNGVPRCRHQNRQKVISSGAICAGD